MRITRFERKIVLALLAVGFMPLVAALVLGRGAVREAYEVGINPRIRGELESALTLYTEHLQVLRDHAERTTRLVARDPDLLDGIDRDDVVGARVRLTEIAKELPNVAQIRVFRANSPWTEYRDEARLSDPEKRPLTLDVSPRPDGNIRVEVTTTADWAPFRAHQRAAEIVKVYEALESESSYLTATYLGVFIVLLFSVIVVSVAVGIMLSRRVTRRVTTLARATDRVGAGDLTVQVPVDTHDEVGDLTLAFNKMVRDLGESQDRIHYLQRISAWQQFARRLAHEIKNPLTPIQLAVQEMHTSYRGEDQDYRRKLDDARTIVEEEIATLRRLVGEFSAFAKLPKAELQSADLGLFVKELARSSDAILEDEAQRAKHAPTVRIRYEPASEALPVRIDPMMLKRCVENLVRNAVEACREKPDCEVVVRVTRRGREAIIDVDDDGPGIPTEDRERVFDPYVTTKAEGTGLGLPIVKKVVLEHGATIECLETPSGGARFRITLPIVPDGTSP